MRVRRVNSDERTSCRFCSVFPQNKPADGNRFHPVVYWCKGADYHLPAPQRSVELPCPEEVEAVGGTMKIAYQRRPVAVENAPVITAGDQV